MAMPSTLCSSRNVEAADADCGEQATGEMQRQLAAAPAEAAEQLRQPQQVEMSARPRTAR